MFFNDLIKRSIETMRTNRPNSVTATAIALIGAAWVLIRPLGAYAETVESLLNIKPNRCIALHQGQMCYQKLDIHWRTPALGEFCLYATNTQTPLICWEGNSLQNTSQTFKSDASVIYQIRPIDSKEVLSEQKVKVAWVYKTSRKSASGWRLF